MAQLIKLSDYISRYEIDIYRYPGRYVRLKKERWNQLQKEHQKDDFMNSERDDKIGHVTDKIGGLWNKMTQLNKQSKENERTWLSKKEVSMEYLRTSFLHDLFQFQLKWASSTISEISYVNKRFYHDSLLTFLLRELPDTCFVLYEPVFLVKKAPVDLNIIIITPFEIWLLTPLFGNEKTVFRPDSERFWLRINGTKEEKFINPIVSIKRMRTVIEPILVEAGLSCPIRTAIMAKDSYIDVTPSQNTIKKIDRRTIQDWKKGLVMKAAPIKHGQLKIAEALLYHCVANAQERTPNI
ncbi:hypothetical protein [Evansella cellulosilytica]|uniref:NERD domain-containing protein n=1 Tax=Evansella cellulosilytica (strain ATCC 21833 / DSM 2522 / FERM P-1141 / JCM 9156 / N-4) TaxID=649639 RepID=E6U194_EVAC2|nr:hypothetical protein [Evansella cellulosilytica]ADU31540.1 hypothetical protein Bcell_3298 [Evansella cellulosilytica DSM 2522]